MNDDSIPIIFAIIFIQVVAMLDAHTRLDRIEAISAAQISAQKTLGEHVRAQLEDMQIYNAAALVRSEEASGQRRDNARERREEFQEIYSFLQSGAFHYAPPEHRIPMRAQP